MTEDDLQVMALERSLGADAPKAVVLAGPGFRIHEDGSAVFAAVPVNKPRPVYDEATDGNRFAWILRAAAQVRIQEQAANETRRIRLTIARRSAMPVLVSKDAAK